MPTDIMYITIYVILVAALVYFLKVSPSKKMNLNKKAMIAALKPGDKIMLEAGVYGTITEISENTIILEIGTDNNTLKITVDKEAVKTVLL